MIVSRIVIRREKKALYRWFAGYINSGKDESGEYQFLKVIGINQLVNNFLRFVFRVFASPVFRINEALRGIILPCENKRRRILLGVAVNNVFFF